MKEYHRFTWLLFLSGILTACSDSKSDSGAPLSDASSLFDASSQPDGDEGGDASNSSGGSGGSSNGVQPPPPCAVDADCDDEIEAYVARLSAPEPSGEPLSLTAYSCKVESARQQTESCTCALGERVVNISPCWGFKSDMSGVGRTTGLLLYREFAGCTPGDAASCDAACAAVAEKIEQERQHVFSVEMRTVSCVDLRCRAVARIDDSCYAGNLISGPMQGPFDCSLTDQEIVALAERRVDESTYPDCFWQPTE